MATINFLCGICETKIDPNKNEEIHTNLCAELDAHVKNQWSHIDHGDESGQWEQDDPDEDAYRVEPWECNGKNCEQHNDHVIPFQEYMANPVFPPGIWNH